MRQEDPNPSHFLKLSTLTKMQLQHIKGFLGTGICFLPTGGKFRGTGHDKGEKGGFSDLFGEGPDPQCEGIGSSVALVGYTLHG